MARPKQCCNLTFHNANFKLCTVFVAWNPFYVCYFVKLGLHQLLYVWSCPLKKEKKKKFFVRLLKMKFLVNNIINFDNLLFGTSLKFFRLFFFFSFFEFLHKTTSSQILRNINTVFNSNITIQQTVSNWFTKFCAHNFALTNEPHSCPESRVNNNELKITIECDSCQSAYELGMYV